MVAAALAGAALGSARAPVMYQSSAVVMVVPPGAGNENARMNPFVNLDNNMVQLALVVTTAVNSPQTAADLGAPDETIKDVVAETIKAAPATAGSGGTPQIQITVEGSDPAIAQATTNRLVGYTREVLTRMQTEAGVTGATYVDSLVIVPASASEEVSATPLRPIAAHALLGAAAMGVLLAAIAGVATLIQRRRGSASRPRSADGTVAAPDNVAAEAKFADFANDSAATTAAEDAFAESAVEEAVTGEPVAEVLQAHRDPAAMKSPEAKPVPVDSDV